jgi:hypothetical protein
MAASEHDLDVINQQIAEAQARIGRQRQLVEKLRRDQPGRVSQESAELLSKMLEALEELKEHRRVIIEDLQRSDKAR